jgi:hypothetical protein
LHLIFFHKIFINFVVQITGSEFELFKETREALSAQNDELKFRIEETESVCKGIIEDEENQKFRSEEQDTKQVESLKEELK